MKSVLEKTFAVVLFALMMVIALNTFHSCVQNNSNTGVNTQYQTGFFWQEGRMEAGIYEPGWDGSLRLDEILFNSQSLTQDMSNYFAELDDCECYIEIRIRGENSRANYLTKKMPTSDNSYSQFKIIEYLQVQGNYEFETLHNVSFRQQ